ncbi:MAG: FAD-binding protein, partial [Bacteroidetes bacterium]|nr:FAD-binding protein [Bacteroidota bacterium]
MYKQFKEYAKIDISKEKMEVAPTAHYSMGGICSDEKGRTNIPNLFVIGEVTSGTHGANRLGGNSLLEIIGFGKFTGQNIIKSLKRTNLIPLDENLIENKKNEFIQAQSVKAKQSAVLERNNKIRESVEANYISAAEATTSPFAMGPIQIPISGL